jgi:hypothetical protein
MISASQCRAARALLDWTQDQLAENAQVAMRNNLVSIASALEAAGIAFIPENGEGVGVRFRKVELEYSNSVKIRNHDVLVSVRYRGKPYRVVIPRSVIDDIGRTNHLTDEQRVRAVQNRFPIFLRAAEETIIGSQYATADEVVLHHDRFPTDVF